VKSEVQKGGAKGEMGRRNQHRKWSGDRISATKPTCEQI